jgi:peptide methionine sulfoxide reductase MsrA
LGTKFEGQAKKFISHMRYLREECKRNFELKKEKIAEINKDRMSDLERKNKEIYDRIRKVKKEFREFLDKRQAYLEKNKNMMLGKKDWSMPSKHYQEYLDFMD